jgi:hypothetical protein
MSDIKWQKEIPDDDIEEGRILLASIGDADIVAYKIEWHGMMATQEGWVFVSKDNRYTLKQATANLNADLYAVIDAPKVKP